MELERMDNALKASWQSVAQNMNMVRLLLITYGASEATHALLSRSEAMPEVLMRLTALNGVLLSLIVSQLTSGTR